MSSPRSSQEALGVQSVKERDFLLAGYAVYWICAVEFLPLAPGNLLAAIPRVSTGPEGAQLSSSLSMWSLVTFMAPKSTNTPAVLSQWVLPEPQKPREGVERGCHIRARDPDVAAAFELNSVRKLLSAWGRRWSFTPGNKKIYNNALKLSVWWILTNAEQGLTLMCM